MSFGERFLENPALFPARHSGEPWGDHAVVIDFAGGPYAFTQLSAVQAAAARDRFGELCRLPARQPAVTVRVFRAPEEEFRAITEVPWEYTFAMDYAPAWVRLAGLRFMARLDWTPALRVALWTPEDAALVSHGAFENLFRVIVAYRLLEQGGVLLHSAGVVRDGEAYLFCGCSGAGKSTLSRLSLTAGYTVLSDDINALCPTATGIVAEKLPFAGDLGQTAAPSGSYPVRAVCRLEKGFEHALQRLSPARAVAALLACAPFVNQNPYRQDALLHALTSLLTKIPAFTLQFAPNAQFWDLLNGRRARDSTSYYSLANYDLYTTMAKLILIVISHNLMINQAIECIVLN